MNLKNLDELAYIVSVRNHIYYLVNHERNLLTDYKRLDNIRIQLDKLFIEKSLNLDNITSGGIGVEEDVPVNSHNESAVLQSDGCVVINHEDNVKAPAPKEKKVKKASKKVSKKKKVKVKKSAVSYMDPELAARVAKEKKKLMQKK